MHLVHYYFKHLFYIRKKFTWRLSVAFFILYTLFNKNIWPIWEATVFLVCFSFMYETSRWRTLTGYFTKREVRRAIVKDVTWRKTLACYWRKPGGEWWEDGKKMDVTLRRDGGDSTSGAGQYLSSLLQLAFVISKLLLKTDLLKRGQTEKIKRQTERRSRQGKPEAQHAENTTFNTLKLENNTNSHVGT